MKIDINENESVLFKKWIKEKGWWFIHPLKVFCHKNKEIYKTEIELYEIFLNRKCE